MNQIQALLRRYPVIIQLMRFAAIGAINTALDFIILNFVTKSFNVTSGVELGVLNVVSFSAAIIQSYFWNKAWAFAEESGATIFQNFFRLAMIGGLGVVAVVAVLLGTLREAAPLFFAMILIGFIIIELILWKAFQLHFGQNRSAGTQFASFVIVSIIGLLINSFIIVIASHYITPFLEFYINTDSIKNVAKILATLVSLMWNFLGYKLIVFKK